MELLFNQLKPVSTLKSVKKDANVLFQGEIPRKVLIVRDGVVRAYTITSSGEERIVALYSNGDILPLSWVMGETNNTLFYYDAVTDVRMMAVDRGDFMQAVSSAPENASQLLKYVAKQYTAMLLRITGLEQSRAVEKIGFTLYFLMFRYGKEVKPGIYVVDLKMSQVMIASLVGLTRESTTKNLKVLKDKGVINYTNAIYTINKEKLESYLGEDSFRDIEI